jgi:predicted metal-dependent phosphoesterase TrpH
VGTMKIDLHIHTKDCSDGKMSLKEIFKEACKRKIDVISITDHDSMDCQVQAKALAEKTGIEYITGVELNITFSHPEFTKGKSISLDLLAYGYDCTNSALKAKLKEIARYREERALKILNKINFEFEMQGVDLLTEKDIRAIQDSVDGVFGRPHIATYLVKKGIVSDKQEAFDKYLVKCNVPKYPFKVEEASTLVHNAQGKLILAHPNDPNGTSLIKASESLDTQTKIIEGTLLSYIDGIECYHSRHDEETVEHYVNFAKKHDLLITGGSDCHQNPIIMGSVDVPDFVYEQFKKLM